MDESQYRQLYNELRSIEDVERLHATIGIDKELLLVIHTQRASRVSTRKYYVIKNQIQKIRRNWNNGMTITQIAKMYEFSPVLMAMFVLLSDGISRKEFWRIVRGERKTTRRIMCEIEEACKNDVAYSPWGLEVQRKRGQWGEELLNTWLDNYHLEYQVERDLRGKFKKTPDCLLAKPLKLNGEEIMWIESKANFGDGVEFNRNMRKQVIPYTEMFGRGIIVYWFGFVDGLRPPDGVHLVSKEFFDNAVIDDGHIVCRSKG